MSRKPLYLAILSILLLAAAATGAVLLVGHEPAFYRRAAVPPGERRKGCSSECVREFVRMLNDALNARSWDAHFTDEQVNSYFKEDFIKEHNAELPLPDGIREPRVSFEADRVRLGFRYGKHAWSTIVSMDLRAWLVGKEPNVVALEFQALHAGGLPIAAQSLLDWVADLAHKKGIDSTWYRYNGHPVLLLRFQVNRHNPTFQLQHLEIRPGMLLIAGRSPSQGK